MDLGKLLDKIRPQNDMSNDNDNNNDTQRSPTSVRRPGLTSVSVGVMTQQKKSVALMRLALLAKCAPTHCYGLGAVHQIMR